MIKVYQISLSAPEMRLVELEGWEASPKIRAYAQKSVGRLFKVESLQFYELVAEVDAVDLEEAFKLMNLWEEPEKVRKLKMRVPSMSVGDVLEMDGDLYRVASFGFDKLEGAKVPA